MHFNFFFFPFLNRIILPRNGSGAQRISPYVTELVQTFADLHEIPDGIVPGLSAKVEDTLAKRAKRRLLLTMPVSAPDGGGRKFNSVDP